MSDHSDKKDVIDVASAQSHVHQEHVSMNHGKALITREPYGPAGKPLT